MSRPG
jgi:hypothetical protein